MNWPQQDVSFQAIHRRILQSCGPVPWPGSWAFLADYAGHADGSDAVGPVVDAEALRSGLLEEFSPEMLAAAGVIDLTPDGEPVLAGPLGGAVLIPTQHVWNRATDILTAAGLLSGSSLPVLAAADDVHTDKHVKAALGRLYVAAGLPDVAVLRALGLPATTAHGMGELDWPQMRHLCNDYDLPRTATGVQPTLPEAAKPTDALGPLAENLRRRQSSVEVPPSGRIRPRLTLVAWSPGSCSQDTPPAVANAIHRLGQFATHLRTDVSRIDVWRPTKKDLERLKFVLGLAEVEQVRTVLLESCYSCVPLSK
jgi:hypothetical protein